MKLDNPEPMLENGWLIAGERVEYGNTPVIQISQISSVCFYEDSSTTMNGEIIKSGKWHIKFDEQKWQYKNYDNMNEDYTSIIKLIANIKEDKNYI